MDLVSAIGLISSFVTLEEAGRSWILIIKDKIKRKEIDINNWDSDDPLVQVCLDRFKTDMGDKYKDHIFSKEEIQDIIRGFFEQNRELRIGNEEKKQMTQIIEDILYAYNEYAKSLMSSGERTLHNTLSSDFSKIMDKLGMIEEQPRKENIKKFLRAIEISKEIELENIEELINGEYEIDRSEIIETIQAGREKLVSIQGNAGSGKSVVCKKLLKGKEYVLVTRAENLSTGKKVNELWDCDVEDAILWLENKPLYIFIDAIEFIADYLGLFHRVYASLKIRDFPAELTTASKLQQTYLDEHKNAKNPMEIIERFGGVFDETYDRFAMQYSFKTEEDGKGDRSRNFIFNDLQFHSVFEGENAFIDIDTDMKAKQNWLRFTKRRPTEKDGGVLSLLASVKGCLTYFQNGARNLSFNYKHHKDEDKRPGDDDYTFENAIESVLTEFHLSREQIRYLKPIVMGGQVKSKKDKKDSNGKMSLKYFDRSVYDRGFRYYDFIDDPNHSMRSEIQLFDFQDSPERILLHLSEKAQIIGISATATLDTVIGNYDLEYLQRMLQDKFYVMPEVDKCRLQESFRTFVANYDKVNIHVEPVCYSTDDTAELAEIFNGNEALIKKYAEKLSISFERVEYAKNNFIRVVKVMKAFILNDSVKSFLCLNNKLPQENKGLFDIKLLEEFADAIIKLYGIKGLKGKDLLYSINSEDYDAKRVEFIQRLSKGEKLFVISSYNTVGAGQNLQYKAPGNATIVAVNDYDRGDMEKDFDYIYLEKPTNLLVNVDSKKGIEAEDLIRFVYQMEFLMERGEVSRKDGIAVIKDAFICFSGGYTFSGKKGEPYKTDSVNNYALRTLIQAVGRICRTGLKNPDIYIYVDNTFLTDYDLSIVEQRMLNPEFAELVKVGKIYYNGQANENLDIAVMENRAGTLALKAMQIINELKRNWTNDSIDYWNALRELCLMRPTLSRKNVEQNSQYQLVYICAPGEITTYSYEQEGDYNKNINIKFDGSLPQKMSEDEVHLKEIMQIPGVKALFEKHGYATSFVPNEFILTPPMFNNIYKGALGEVVGKYILEQYAGVTLQEMPPEFFELFDYTLGNGVYVDFKLWKETMLISAEEEKKNVLEKLDKCGGKRAVIINIMLDRNMQITSSDSGRIIEIPYLYRLDRKEIGTEIIAKINREGYLQ